MNKIALFVSCHKPCEVLNNDIVRPIQVGSAINGRLDAFSLHDDDGDNISDKNRMYCELTAQYWAWKNYDADYYGFMHYRRYFSFSDEKYEEDGYGNIRLPYIKKEYVDKLGLDEETVQRTVSSVDVVSVASEDVFQLDGTDSVYEHYKNSPHHHIADLDLIVEIIKEKYPQYSDITQRYLSGRSAYFCNMFVLKRDLFFSYCEWLFDILEEYERRASIEEYDVNEYRVAGFLAERLWGIYYEYLKSQGLKCLELQKAFFASTEPRLNIMPAYRENNVPVVIAANDIYVPYVGVMLRSLADNAAADRNYDVIVLTKDISPKNQEVLQAELSDYPNLSIRFFDVSGMYSGVSLPTHFHITVETYYRLLMQDILENYDKVVYIDSDLVLLTDIADLYSIDIGDSLIGAVADIDMAGCFRHNKNRQKYVLEDLGLKNPYGYVNAGVLVMNLVEFRKQYSAEHILDVISRKEYLYMDQDILNILCEGKITYLDMSWNVVMNWVSGEKSRLRVMQWAPHGIYFDYLESRKHIKIAHYAGGYKPWNDPSCDLADHFWKYAERTSFMPVLLERMEKAKTQTKDAEYAQLLNKYNTLNDKYNRTKHSIAFRIGRIITWLPRKVVAILHG